jgi:YcaO-like protein with predicted kinase domain
MMVGALPRVDAALKRFRSGTHRAVPPEETVRRVSGFKQAMGITRVANVTGLDVIGIPVVMVCRPNARSLSVSQGKGLSLAAAQASGIMESIELYHAERITLPLKLATHDELRFTHRMVDVDALSRPPEGCFRDDLRLLWIEAVDLLRGGSTWLPFECVHVDGVRPPHPGSGAFTCSSNGLASGNNVWEATIHALTEVIEREGLQRFAQLSEAEREARRIRLDTVDDEDARALLEQFDRAQIDVIVWETTERTGIASFKCGIATRPGARHARIGTFYGAGCHPSKSVALCRALTEAAQGRLTVISGARDDVSRAFYAMMANPDRSVRERSRLSRAEPTRSFSDVPTRESDDLEEELRWVLGRLDVAGFDSALVVDLTMPAFGIPVVRAIVPRAGGVDGMAPSPRNEA